MAKSIGKWYFLLILCCLKEYAADLIMQTKSTTGMNITQSVAGEPFLVQLSVRGNATISNYPRIANLPHAVILEKGITHNINVAAARRETNYNYLVRFDNPGTVLIGPASVMTDQGELTAASCNLQITASGQHAPTQRRAVFATLMIDKKRVVVGEKVPYTVCLYYQENKVSIQAAQPCRLPGDATVTAATGAVQEIQGIRYACAEWHGVWYPDAVGTAVIPPVRIDYKLHDGSLFDQFFALADTRHEYTNNFEMIIDPLPASKEPIQAIGHIDRFTAQISPCKAHRGDAMVFNLELMGAGNFDTIKQPVLKLPASLSWYESQRSITGEEPAMTCRFSYIVQGMAEGTLEIPGQSFTYYDTKTRHIVTLTTVPLSIVIDAFVPSIDTISSSMQDSSLQEKSNYSWWLASPWRWWIPLWLFILAMIVPVLFLMIITGHKVWLLYQRTHGYSWYRKRAVKKALQAIVKARSKQKGADLYDIFISFFATVDYHHSSVSTLQDIAPVIATYFSKEEQSAWHSFWASLVALRFGPAHLQESNERKTDQELYHHAVAWIKKLGQQS